MFAITAAHCQMGKISNNLEKHGDEDVPAWTIPLVGILVDLAAFEALLHDAHASEAFFVRNPETDVLEPRPWLTYAEPIALTEAYDGMTTKIKVGEQVLEFERCRLKDLVLGRFYPGMAQIDCKLQLYPGLDHANLVLQEAQNMPVILTVLDAKIAAKKKSRQQDLPLQQAAETPKPADQDDDDQEELEDDGTEEDETEEATATAGIGANDPLYAEAVTFVRESRITSVDGVQVRLKIDHFRARLLLAAMEDAGIVGPVRDDNSREIFDGATHAAPGPDTEAGVWPMAAPGDGVPTSRTGRAVTAHAKREARKRGRPRKNGEARTH